jgi:hypothetical protein
MKRTREPKSKVFKGKFMKKSDKDVSCDGCSSTFSLSTSTGTLKKHLDKCKKSIEKGWVVKDRNQPTIEETLDPSLPFEEQKTIDDALTLWLKVQGKPLSLVEELEFKKFVKTLNRRYVVPGWYVILSL